MKKKDNSKEKFKKKKVATVDKKCSENICVVKTNKDLCQYLNERGYPSLSKLLTIDGR